ncbi:MAG: 3-phosphoshikimate 1-carboxyvinyltransferase [Solirubrobacterales bacterium]
MIYETAGVRGLKGEIIVPADKSISHRTLMLSALAAGESSVTNLLGAEDVQSTARCLRDLGVPITSKGEKMLISGCGLFGFQEPFDVLDCGNSGTTMRLMSGILAAQPFLSVVTGDASLRKRPMRRVADPLCQMGARIDGRDQGRLAPLAIRGGGLQPITYRLPMASAQVKSSILLAGLHTEGETTVLENVPTRDHTERMLKSMGASIEWTPGRIQIRGLSSLNPQDWFVPGDISSAAFFLVAASIVSEAEVLLRDVGVNPTRTGILEALTAMGADISAVNQRSIGGEPVADLAVRPAPLKPVTLKGPIIPRLIDEIPVLAIAMAMADGISMVRDADELRAKESDRIRMICSLLDAIGVANEELPDGFVVHGKGVIPGGATVSSGGDHRIAMAASVAGLAARAAIRIDGFDCVAISYPGFAEDVQRLIDQA